MGGGYSFSQTASHIYPLYFTQDKPTEEDGAAAKRVWELVKTDSGNRYKEMKQNPEFDKMSTLSWFYEVNRVLYINFSIIWSYFVLLGIL